MTATAVLCVAGWAFLIGWMFGGPRLQRWLDDRDRRRRLRRLNAQIRQRVTPQRSPSYWFCEQLWHMPTRQPRRRA